MVSDAKRAILGLEIAKLDESGNTLRRINCLPGRITVLRSVRPMEAKLYEEALTGQPTSAKFNAVFQGAPYDPTSATIVGVGNDFGPEDGDVLSYLISQGATRQNLSGVLKNLELDGLETAKCIDLGKSQQRALRLYAATLNPQKPVILVDPFNHLPKNLIESSANAIVDFVSANMGLVVVPRLGVKPDAWVENEYVSRAQLERPRSATVGFGSDALSRDELLAAMKKSDTPARGSKILGVDLTAVDIGDRKSSPMQIIKLFSLAVLIAGIWYLGSSAQRPSSLPKVPVASLDQPQAQPFEELEVAENGTGAYPTEISEAVIAAYMSPDEVIRKNTQAFEQNNHPPPPSQTRSSEQTPVTNEQQTYQETDPTSDEELAERRRQIYERFMEAINRARTAQQDSQE